MEVGIIILLKVVHLPKQQRLQQKKGFLVGGFNPFFSCTGAESELDACMHHRTKTAMASDE